MCEFLTCRNCVEKLVGAESKCPECGTFAWVKDMKTNRQLANTVSMCAKIRMVIGSDDDNNDDHNVTNKRHTNSTTGNIHLYIYLTKHSFPTLSATTLLVNTKPE